MADAAPPPSTWLPAPSASPPPPSGPRRFGAVVGGVAVLGVVAAVLIGGVVWRPRLIRVPSHSMEPTIQSGAYVLVSQNVGTIARGDVVTFRNPTQPTVSHLFRVIVLPGERFQIVDGVVHVDGKPLDEPYVVPENRDDQNHGPYQVPAGRYYLLGDNRRDAMDSRYLGAIERDRIWGKWVRR